MTKESAQLAEKQEQGIDQILSDIKEVITNASPATDEVLELTEVIQEAKAANESKESPTSAAPANMGAPSATFEAVSPSKPKNDMKDILATIDGATQPSSTFASSNHPTQIQTNMPTNHFHSANSGTMESIINDAVAATSRQTMKNFMKMTEKNDIDSLKLRSGGTVEDIIIELIKPQLSDWLNKNLPALVTSVVEKEIKKLVPKDE